jgi:hypothetical protein
MNFWNPKDSCLCGTALETIGISAANTKKTQRILIIKLDKCVLN